VVLTPVLVNVLLFCRASMLRSFAAPSTPRACSTHVHVYMYAVTVHEERMLHVSRASLVLTRRCLDTSDKPHLPRSSLRDMRKDRLHSTKRTRKDSTLNRIQFLHSYLLRHICTYKILLLSEQKTRAIMTPEYLARNQIHNVTLLWL